MGPSSKIWLAIIALVVVLLAGSLLEEAPSESLRAEGDWIARLNATPIGRFLGWRSLLDQRVNSQTIAIARADSAELRNSAYFARATSYDALGRYDLAERDLDSAIALKGLAAQDLSEDLLLRAQNKFQSGDFAGTQSDCSRLLASPQQFTSSIFIMRGWARIYLAKPDIALADFNSAISSLPATHAQMRDSVLKFLFMYGNEKQKVLPEIDRAFNNTVAAAYSGRAAAYRALGDYAKSLDDYDTAIKAMPNAPNLYAGRARTQLAAGHWGAAMSDFWARNTLFWKAQF